MNSIEPIKNTKSLSTMKIDHDRLRSNMEKFKAHSKATSTVRTYNSAWANFAQFCEVNELVSLPADPATVCAYLEHVYSRGNKYSSIHVMIAAITYMHKQARLPSPVKDVGVMEMLRGIKRVMAEEGKVKAGVKPNTTLEAMQKIAAACDDTLTGIRNRAMILTAFGGWLRKSEIISIKVENIIWNDNCFIVDIGKSKDNQAGDKDSLIDIPKVEGQYADLCPYRAMKEWLEKSGVTSGCAFRQIYKGKLTDKPLSNVDHVYKIIMKVAKRAGVPSSEFTPHRALRATPITLALLSGRPFVETMRKARHRSLGTTSYYIDRSAIPQHEISQVIYKPINQ